MIVTDTELHNRLFEVLDSLTDEERQAWRDSLIAWGAGEEAED